MDLLRAEIAKAKAAAKEAKEALGSDGRDADAGKKYARRGDLEKAREERERERRRQLKLERAESEKQESSPRVRESTVEEPGKLLGDSDVSSLEIIQILRSMGLPVTLFGEDSSARLARMKKAKQEGNHDNYQLGEGHNTANTFLGRQGEGDQGGEERDRPSKRRRRKEEGQKDKEEDEGDVDDHTLVRRFFKQLLRDWEQDLNDRSETDKSSMAGRNMTRTQKQTKDYMRPMFKLCREKKINPGILTNLVKMINFMKEGEFVKAHDIYMLTAIGNAPWPIGLTMVGIHERSGREKIESRNVAHIMNNEEQRKYLVSIKRLMTYLQDKRVDVPPSKKVLVR